MDRPREGLKATFVAVMAVAALLLIPAVAVLLLVPAVADAAPGSAANLVPLSPVAVITQFPTTGGTVPVSVTAGPDGNIWYTEVNVAAGDSQEIGRLTFLDPRDGPEGSITNFSRNIAGPPPLGGLNDIAAGPDGNVWFTGEYGMVGRITPSGVASVQTNGFTGGEDASDPEGITAGPDGNLWFAGAQAIGRITPHLIVTEFSKGLTPDSEPQAITVGPDHNLWFTEINSGKIGTITPQGVLTEFQISDGVSPITTGPDGIATGPDGNLWVTDFADDSILRIPPSQCAALPRQRPGLPLRYECRNALDVSLANVPGLFPHAAGGVGDGPGAITAGPNNELWFTVAAGLGLAEVTTGGVVTPISQGVSGVPGTSLDSIAPGPDGTLWFTEAIPGPIPSETLGGMIGEVTFCSPTLCEAHLAIGAGELTGTLHKTATIGVLVQRREGGRIVTVGRVPLGHHRSGPFQVRWRLRVNGRRLAPGRYLLTLRALKGNQVIDETRPATITVPARTVGT